MNQRALNQLKMQDLLLILGDMVTTDHISPAGNIQKESPTGEYFMEHQILPKDYNSYGSRRGNHEVMMRGTFANIRIRNEMAPGTEGGFTKLYPEEKVMPVYNAVEEYKKRGTRFSCYRWQRIWNRFIKRLGCKRNKTIRCKSSYCRKF